MSDAPAEIEFLTVEVVSNHPFVDGNKRAGLLAAQVFLDVNGVISGARADREVEAGVVVGQSGANLEH